MPSKTKVKNAAIAARSAALPRISDELMDQFVTGPMTGQAVNAATAAFKKALIERALGAELGRHLGYAPGAAEPEAASNHRNGTSAKTVFTDDGPLRIDVPRDREGSFAPPRISKRGRCFTGFDDKIVAMYARGMTVREVNGRIDIENGIVKQRNFPDQPLLTLAQTPRIETHILPSDRHPGGVGEVAVPPLAPALANALFALTGKRLRELPLAV